jgi:Right handed beta helix region
VPASRTLLGLSCLVVAVITGASSAAEPTASVHGGLSVTDFLPRGFVKDGSVSYQAEIQKALDATARDGRTLVFPPMVYQVDESGLQLHSRLTLWMYGAVFRLDEHRKQDGHVFHGKDVENLTLLGGEIVGRNDAWPEGVNIRGIHLTGQSRNVRIRDMHIHGLSSNGVGIFGSKDGAARDVWLIDTVIENCCNRYGDYLSAKVGPEKGSVREDQGLVAFYHVHDFVVRGCRFEKSRSDGTHFYRCRQGQFVHNRVYGAKMGGYFAETCEDVLASDNVIRDNGSRGATIERGSRNCILKGNVIAGSGREGLWAPDCTGLVVTGNVFDRNGRKPNGNKPTQRWNANITINEDPSDPTKSPAADYLVADNILYTTAGQLAAIRIDSDKVKGVVVKNNLLRGENRRVLVEGEKRAGVLVQGNSE